MELKELTEKTLEIFNVDNVNDLSAALYDTVIDCGYERYQQFRDLVKDLSVDWLQKIFQYYAADRKEKMQDYTPKSLAEFVARLSETPEEGTVYDMCAGSGALTIQKWNINKKLTHVCLEFDEKVIPFLLFNLAVRNMDGYVIQGNALTGEYFKAWYIESDSNGAFSEVTEDVPALDSLLMETAISNPPFNMKWEYPDASETMYINGMLAPESNANYAFILSALQRVTQKAVYILPCNVLDTTQKKETQIKQFLVDNNLIEAVILCPNKMFEATDISTCILVLNRNKENKDISFVDMRQTFTTEIREQNGQYGGKSHTNRTYAKEVKTFSPEQINKVLECIKSGISEPEFSNTVPISEIIGNGYGLNPSKYIEFKEREYIHRPFEDIARDINRIEREKSILKLTINEKLAKELGFDIDLYKQKDETAEEVNESLKTVGCGCRFEYRRYLSFSKNKNEFKIENQDKEKLSSILVIFLSMWKQHIYFLNQAQNELVTEFRDAMLNDLMSGKIDISEAANGEI